MGSKIIINGTTIEGDVSGGITIRNGVVMIGGKTVKTGASGEVRVVVEGSCGGVDTDSSVTVTGNVAGDVTAGNSASIAGNVDGGVQAGNSVTCGKVGGSIRAGGHVTVR